MTGPTLYDIDAVYRGALAAATEYAAEHDGLMPDDLAAQLDAASADRDTKLGNCIAWMKEELAESAKFAAELKATSERLDKVIKRCTSNAEWMKAYIASVAGAGNKWHGVQGDIAWGKSYTTEVECPVDSLAPEYVRVVPEKREPDKDAIKAAINAGKLIDGCKVVKHDNVRIK
jgi:hypothetical protein